jgi:hypothetical protein
MKIPREHLSALESLGYTPDEARFLYIAAMHSGYFVPRQFLALTHSKWGKRSDQFARKLESRGHASWREYQHLGGVYHLSSKTLYRAIENEGLRHARRHSTEFIRTRLLLLDFMLAHPEHDYFATESEKISYFCERRGVPKDALPAKAYFGTDRTKRLVRYFVDKFPLFLDTSKSPGGTPPTFSYVDSGEATLAGLRHHLERYKQLFLHLGDFRFLYIARSTVHFVAAERCFSSFAGRTLAAGLSADLRRYFCLRAAWDEKRYGDLTNEDVEWLEQANARFREPETERDYQAWRAGQRAGEQLAEPGEKSQPVHQFRFSSCLVASAMSVTGELGKAG